MTIDLDQLESAAKAATPGPWETDYRQRYVFAENGVNVCEIRGYGELIYMVPESDVIEQMRSNGAFIAAVSPDVVLELIAEMRKARAAQEWIAQRIVGHHDACAHPCKCDGCPPCEAECVNCWLEAAREAVEGKQ